MRLAVAVLGPPAAGKSTAVSAALSAGLGICHFKVRLYFKHLLKEGDPVAAALATEIQHRSILDDSVVQYAFAHFIQRAKDKRVILVEGDRKSVV